MSEYISPPIKQEPEEYAEIAYGHMTNTWADWEPHPGNLETVLIEAIAQIAAVLGTLASSVLDSIFRWFGAQMVGIAPDEASAASASTTWTMIDNAGYTIPAGTQVGVRSSGDELHIFEVTQDVVVAPGATVTTAGEVNIVALEEGAGAGNLGSAGGPVEVIDQLDYVTAVTLVAATGGGIDAEEDDKYLNRLREFLTLIAPRPVIADDYALYTKVMFPEVDRALALDLTNPGVSEGARYTLTNTTGANAATLQVGMGAEEYLISLTGTDTAAAIETLIRAGIWADADVNVSGGPLGTNPVTIDFAGALNNQYVRIEKVQDTGGSYTLVEVRPGGWQFNVEKAVTVVPIDAAGTALSGGVRAAIKAELQAKREGNFIVNVEVPTFTAIDLRWSYKPYPEFDPAAIEAATEAVAAAFVSPANWGQPQFGQTRDWKLERVIRVNDLVAALDVVEGVNYVKNVKIEGATHDYTMVGNAPLPTPGTMQADLIV